VAQLDGFLTPAAVGQMLALASRLTARAWASDQAHTVYFEPADDSGPAAEAINGEVFVVHGGVAAVLDPPRVRASFHAAEHGSPDGMWTLESVHAALSPAFGDAAATAGFMCEDTLVLATATIGFPAPGTGAAP
jgi:hypothetical protein